MHKSVIVFSHNSSDRGSSFSNVLTPSMLKRNYLITSSYCYSCCRVWWLKLFKFMILLNYKCETYNYFKTSHYPLF